MDTQTKDSNSLLFILYLLGCCDSTLCPPSISLAASTQSPLLVFYWTRDAAMYWGSILSSFLLYISPVVSSYSLWTTYVLTLTYTSLAQMLFPVPDSHLAAYLTCPVSTLDPGGYVKPAPSEVFTVSFDGHSILSIALATAPQSSSFISWFLLQLSAGNLLAPPSKYAWIWPLIIPTATIRVRATTIYHWIMKLGQWVLTVAWVQILKPMSRRGILLS